MLFYYVYKLYRVAPGGAYGVAIALFDLELSSLKIEMARPFVGTI